MEAVQAMNEEVWLADFLGNKVKVPKRIRLMVREIDAALLKNES